MNELPCEVVRDLLPSYVDGLTSETTSRLVDEHVEGCAPCRAALRAMRAPEGKPSEAVKEIDYLKKNRRHNRTVVLLSLAGALLLAFTVLFLHLFVIGEELHGSVVPRNIRVDGNHLTADLDCLDSARVIKAVYYEEKDGVVTLRARGVLVSFLYGPGAQAVYTASAPIRQVRMADGSVWWDDGAELLALTTRAYQTRHEYVGDMSANNATANALNLTECFGHYENELQTSQQPYIWTIRLRNYIPKSEAAALEDKMAASAFVLLATIRNLDEVRFAYMTDGGDTELVVSADSATYFFGRDIKDCYDSPRLLDDLIRKTELRSRA